MARKLQLADLPANPDPRAALDTTTFLRAARPVLTALTADLLARADADPGIRAALERHHQAELAASRTADDYAVWRRHIVVQVAAAWLLSCVFVRVLEDRSLIAVRIAGPGARDSEEAFFRVAPSLSEREYLLVVFRELARLPAAAPLFAPEHNLVWRLGPSAEGCKKLLQLFRMPNADAPTFRFGHGDTRFLGDLYQHLDDGVRERYALLQTPDFIESFILDRTLEPAIAEYGIDHTDVIDPTCGSGHFLLGAFDRVLNHLHRIHPGLSHRDLASTALGRVYGVDINPYAVAIARFRLTIRFLELGSFNRLLGAPATILNVIVADSLYYGFAGNQGDISERSGQTSEHTVAWNRSGFAPEDPAAAQRILVERTYAAVVGNPPYIAVQDSALREIYRQKYVAASGQYALSAPFMERFFQLARKGGYVGQITSNSFMKREFGTALIEDVLQHLDISLIINTAGAFIPGHGTPTVLIFGRNQPPCGNEIEAVLAKRGEPGIPDVPARGHVWHSIDNQWNNTGFDNEYISVEILTRDGLRHHPWSLEGGGARELKARLEAHADLRLRDAIDIIGLASFTGIDEMFILPHSAIARANIPLELARPVIVGESVRDWTAEFSSSSICPYSTDTQQPISSGLPRPLVRFLWPHRALSESRVKFGGSSSDLATNQWWQWYRWIPRRYSTSLRIVYAEIASHNHFILDRKKSALTQTSPAISLPKTSSTDDHLSILAYLNSSTACYWMKQVSYPKGTTNGDVSTEKGRPENNRYAFSGTALSELPTPPPSKIKILKAFSQDIEYCTRQREAFEPRTLLQATAKCGMLAQASQQAEREDTSLLHRMVAIQEDLDWAVYAIFDLAPPATAGRWSENLELTPEQRPFKSPEPPPHLGPADRELWNARVAAIAGSKELRLIENPVNKRRWWGARGVFAHKVATYAERVADAAIEHIADLAEQALRARCERSMPTVFTAHDLERDLERDPKYHALRDYLHTTAPGRDPLRDQFTRESVPFLAGHRYSPSGRDRHERWREVWALQRIADVSEAELPRLQAAADTAAAAAREAAEALAGLRQRLGFSAFTLASDPPPPRRGARKSTQPSTPTPPPADDPTPKPPELLAAEARELAARGAQNQARLELEAAESHHRKLRKLIPVPSKYEPADFRDANYFRLRGKLDVPRERFISYPGAASDGDPSPVYGWAGWDHLQRALALLQLYYHRKLEESWSAERLIPLLAGLEELLPWVRQWHADERHPDTGERYADALESHIAAGCSELGVTRPQLLAWAPPEGRRGRAPSPVNRSPGPTVKQAKPATASLANRRSARPADAVVDLPADPPPELSNKRRARKSPAPPASTDIPTATRRRGRPSHSG